MPHIHCPDGPAEHTTLRLDHCTEQPQTMSIVNYLVSILCTCQVVSMLCQHSKACFLLHCIVLLEVAIRRSQISLCPALATALHTLSRNVMQGGTPDSHEVARESWVDLKGDVQHTLPLAQPKLLKGVQLYFSELDIQSWWLVNLTSASCLCTQLCWCMQACQPGYACSL